MVVAPCAADGPYSLSGCNHIICTTPSAQALTGYNTPTETNLDLALGDFAVDISCATNYEPSPEIVVTECETSGPYTVQGCESIVCTTPADLTG